MFKLINNYERNHQMGTIKWSNQERNVKDGPFCWTNKMALRIIRKELDKMGISRQSTILSIYHALSEIASNQIKQTFACKQYEIAELAGCGVSTVNRGLKVLSKIGAIESIPGMIDVKEYGIPYYLSPPNTYTMLKVERTYSIGGSKDGYANNAYYIKRKNKG
jgi:hypothetical protein